MTALDLSILDETAPASTGDASSDARQNLIDYASLGGFTLTAETHAWYAAVDAVTTPEEARAASTVLAELRGRDLPATREAADRLAEETSLGGLDTVVAVGKALALTLRVKSTLEVLAPTAYESDQLDTFAAATGSGKWRKEQGAKLTFGQRLNLGRAARGLALAKRLRRSTLHSALVAAAAERTDWAALSLTDSHPVLPEDLAFLDASVPAVDAACEALGELGRLRVDSNPAALSLDALTELVDRLASDEGTLHRLPALRALRKALEEQGYGELVADLTAARADAEAVAAVVAREFGALDLNLDTVTEDAVEAEAQAEAEITAEAAELAAEADTAAVVAAPETPQALVPGPREEDTPVSSPKVTEAVEAEVVAVVAVAEVEVAEVEVVEVEVAAVEAEVAETVAAEPEIETVVSVIESAEVVEAPVEAEVKPKPVKAAKTAEPKAADVAPVADESAASRPPKPAFTPGRPVTAYSADELLSVVAWIDSDGVKRSDDELLRAAMKEFGFARLGPRIKEALGTAIASVRS